MFCQLLKVKKLPYRHTPSAKQPMMHHHVRIWIPLLFALPHWGAFKAWVVAGDSGKLVVPQPPRNLFRRFNASEVISFTLGKRSLFPWREGVVGRCEAASDEEDVAGTKSDVLGCGDLLKLGKGDSGACQR